ncbi:MAG: multicopper oxidase family protein [Microthrixaceae bacterium]
MRPRTSRPLAVTAVAIVAAAAVWAVSVRPWRNDTPSIIEPNDPVVALAEQARRAGDAIVRDVTLTAAPATIDLGDRTVQTWAFNGTVPGPEIRLRAGEVLRARVRNELPSSLTIHWHGIALRNDMDGVPGVTQDPIKPGGELVYEFTAPDPGTYFYHPHTGTQLDRGLYAPLIVEEPSAPTEFQRDFTVLIDDWIDGTGPTPDDVLADLRAGPSTMEEPAEGGMGGMDMGGASGTDMTMSEPSPDAPLGTDTGDVSYPLYVINGRGPTSPAELAVTPGERVLLRLINAGSDTPFRVALGGSKLTVIATDGFPTEPVEVDAILLGMGERYDVIVTLPDPGAFPLVAVAEGRDASALAVLRSGPGELPPPGVKPAELAGRLLSLEDLRAAPEVALSRRDPDRTYRVALTGDMTSYKWGIAASGDNGSTLPVRQGERVRLVIENQTMMWHPIHLHGQTPQVVTGNDPGPRKDTVIVPAMGTVTVDFDADNPGQWVLHCHNIYHAESGMVTVVSYVG